MGTMHGNGVLTIQDNGLGFDAAKQFEKVPMGLFGSGSAPMSLVGTSTLRATQAKVRRSPLRPEHFRQLSTMHKDPSC